jgi:ankyrin repeat protein
MYSLPGFMTYRMLAAFTPVVSAVVWFGLSAYSPVVLSAQNTTSSQLISALRQGDARRVERLLAEGANPEVVNEDGTPALMLATLYADADVVTLLLKRGANPNRTDPAGATALMWAAHDPAKVKALLAQGADVTVRSKTGRSPLLVAAAYPRTLASINQLIARGADVRAEDQGRTNALALAARSSDVEVVRFLVGKGLDPAALSPGARRAAHLRYDAATVEYLMSKDVSPVPETLMWAAVWHSPAWVQRWIAAGADAKAMLPPAQYSRTPLMTAVTSERANAEIVRLLLETGADANVRTSEGETALDWAIYKGDRAKIAVLEGHGATRGNGPRREEISSPPPASGVDARLAVSRSVPRLIDVAARFREQTGCISCHHNAMPALAAAAARTRGIDVDATVTRKNLDEMLGFLKSNSARVMQGDPAVGGEALTAGYVLMALAAHQQPADDVTAMTTHWLLARQMPDGSWLGNGVSRPPSEYSTISHTAVAAAGLVAYPLPGRRAEIASAHRRARQWLIAAQATSAEERAMRLMGLVWTGAPRGRIAAAIDDVRRTQDANGGWSQFGRTDSDAYATGQSLYALHVAGVPVNDPAYRRGVSFLLRTQYPDGAWLVKTHAFPLQRYFESGFPFGRHQWISAAGSSWATMAIAEAIQD